jgi:hypothetical protein
MNLKNLLYGGGRMNDVRVVEKARSVRRICRTPCLIIDNSALLPYTILSANSLGGYFRAATSLEIKDLFADN